MTAVFDDFRLDDASIVRLIVEKAEVQIEIQNWQEDVDVIVFRDVIGLECGSFINTTLSHGVSSNSDAFALRSCMIANEVPNDFQCYSFFSVWTNDPILKIVARSFEAKARIPT